MMRFFSTPALPRSRSKRPGHRSGKSTALLAAALMAATPGLSQTGDQISVQNRNLFPSELFPSIETHSSAEVLLAGMQALYPKRVLRGEAGEENGEPAPARVLPLATGGLYIRVYRLESALAEIERNLPAHTLFVDLRYADSDLQSALRLGSLLAAKEEVLLEAVGRYPSTNGSTALRAVPSGLRNSERPVFILTNGQTSGPVEAVLHELKDSGAVISVGRPTAGGTGSYRPIGSVPDYRVLEGEIRPAGGPSLIESGFQPAILIPGNPPRDREVYALLDEGADLDSLVSPAVAKSRYDEASLVRDFDQGLPRQLSGRSGGPDEGSEPAEPAVDLDLQRAVQIFQALQALGRIPPA